MSKSKNPIFRTSYTPFNPEDYGVDLSYQPSITEQAHIDLHCPNRLMANGQAAVLELAPDESFRDFSEVGDFKESMDKVVASQAAFNALSPDIRAYFDNEPADYVDFLLDESNYDEAVELGILSVVEEDSSPEDFIPTPVPTPPKTESDDKTDSQP